MMFSIPSEQFLLFQAFSLFLQLEQTNALMKSYILRMFSLFSRLFFIFLDDKLQRKFVVFSLTDEISGCHQFLDTQMHFKYSRMLLVHRSYSQDLSSQTGRHFLCWHFSRCPLFGNFPLLTRSPLCLLTSLPHSKWEGQTKLIQLELLYLTDMSCQQYPNFIFKV